MNQLLSCLAHLTQEDQAEIGRSAVEVPFQAREFLIKQGALPDSLFVVTAGRVAVQVQRESGRIDVAVLGPGALFGERSYLIGEPAPAHVVGVERGKVLRIPTAALTEQMGLRPGFGQRLYRSLAEVLAGQARADLAGIEEAQVSRPPLSGRLRAGQVPTSLCAAVAEFNKNMHDLDRRLARGQPDRHVDSAQAQALARSDAAADAGRLCDALLQTLTAAVQGSIEGAQADSYGAYVLRETFPLFMLSRFIDQAQSRPRGLAGDHRTFELIYSNQPAGDGRLGPLIDTWVLRRPALRAVRARRSFLRDTLIDRFRGHNTGLDDSFRLLALGGGGMREIFDLAAAIGDPRTVRCLRPTCLDVDPDALAAGQRIAQGVGLGERFQWVRADVIRLAAGAAPVQPAPQEVIYGDGVLDTLSDAQAIALLGWIHVHLQPHGLLLLSATAPSCPDRALFDHILDWRLRYRGAEELMALVRASPFKEAGAQVRWEENRISAFLMIEK
jgi:CRP-like cAMP-binding protein